MLTTKLSNGTEMPMLGFGVFQIPAQDTEKAVMQALSTGYRLIDTAQAYGNEAEVGSAIQKSDVPRDHICITDKIWVSNFTEERAAASIDASLQKLKTDYIDVMLLHQAYGDYHGAWRALERAYKDGKVRAIGVSNFDPTRLIDMAGLAEIKPMVNQVETHPLWQQFPAHKVMKNLEIQHMAWSPFVEGQDHIFQNPVLQKIAEAHGKTTAQVILRALIQEGIVVIPKSVHKERIEQNFDVFDFELSESEMKQFATLDEGHARVFDHSDPQTVQNLISMIRQQVGGPLY